MGLEEITMAEIITYWEIVAYQKKGPGKTNDKKHDYTMLDQVVVQVEAKNEEEALDNAKKKVKRNHYRLHKIWEYTLPDNSGMRDAMAMTQLKIQAEMLKLLKGLKG